MSSLTPVFFSNVFRGRPTPSGAILRRRARDLASDASALAVASAHSLWRATVVKAPAAGKTELSIKVTAP